MFRALSLVAVLVTAPAAHAQDACVRVSTTGTVAGQHSTGWACASTWEDTYLHTTEVGLLPQAAVIVELYLPWP